MSEKTNRGGLNRRSILLGGSSAIALAAGITDARSQALQLAQAQAPRPAAASGRKPNILILWGDDIGYWNVSAYNQGVMGYRTPNIDRIAREGALFTDWYGQQSCTAGRACFLTG
jgi:hypothetical protein